MSTKPMKFDRQPRYEPLTMSDRKVAAFHRKQLREKERYPLFPQLVETEQHSVETELSKRTTSWANSETSMRANISRSWRSARAIYFSLSAELRSDIAQAWMSWTGPRTAGYFWAMVDMRSGNQAQRVADHKKEMSVHIARLNELAPIQIDGRLAFD